MQIKIIASSSMGNCYLVSNGDSSLLIECGTTIKKIRQALDFKLSSVSGCLVTHEHQDHCKAVRGVMRAGIDVFTGKGTIDALKLTGHRVKPIEAKKRFEVGSFHIMPFGTIHDAAEPLGFLLASHGEKLLFATDTAYIPHKFKGLTHIMIESNYQTEILQRNIENGSISIAQKNRLLFSHFESSNVLKFLGDNDLSKLKEIFLMHLSAGNSDAMAIKRAVMILTGVPVHICKEK